MYCHTTGTIRVNRAWASSLKSTSSLAPSERRSWLSMPVSYKNTRLNIRPSAVAEITMGKKYTVRKNCWPLEILSTSSASSRAMPTWNTMVTPIIIKVLPTAVRMLLSVKSFT